MLCGFSLYFQGMVKHSLLFWENATVKILHSKLNAVLHIWREFDSPRTAPRGFSPSPAHNTLSSETMVCRLPAIPPHAFQASSTRKAKAEPHLQLWDQLLLPLPLVQPNRLSHSKGDVKRSSKEKNMVTDSSTHELWGWRIKHIKMSNSGQRGLHTAGKLSFFTPAKAEKKKSNISW